MDHLGRRRSGRGLHRDHVAPQQVAAARRVRVVVFDHFTTLGIRHIFERPGPPNSPHGTYPSGGVERCILFYGLIAYLLWREVSGRRTTAIWAGAGVAALGFNEAYSRAYLTLHWFTDAVSGTSTAACSWRRSSSRSAW